MKNRRAKWLFSNFSDEANLFVTIIARGTQPENTHFCQRNRYSTPQPFFDRNPYFFYYCSFESREFVIFDPGDDLLSLCKKKEI